MLYAYKKKTRVMCIYTNVYTRGFFLVLYDVNVACWEQDATRFKLSIFIIFQKDKENEIYILYDSAPRSVLLFFFFSFF